MDDILIVEYYDKHDNRFSVYYVRNNTTILPELFSLDFKENGSTEEYVEILVYDLIDSKYSECHVEGFGKNNTGVFGKYTFKTTDENLNLIKRHK